LPTKRVVVAIATRNRPEGCVRTVERIKQQRFDKPTELRIVVVDNAAPAEASPEDLPEDVELLREEELGIAQARNRVVAHCADSVDVIAFIDDDEYPQRSDWLQLHLDELGRSRATISTGPVLPDFEAEGPPWLLAHPLFRTCRYPTGTLMEVAYTGNMVISLEQDEPFKSLWFSPAFGQTGGSDTDFSRRASELGAKIVWVDSAVVMERVPRSRTTFRWVLRRSRRLGANRIQRLREGTPGERGMPAQVGIAVAELVVGLVAASLTPVIGRRLGFIGLGRAARGWGALTAATTGRFVAEYM